MEEYLNFVFYGSWEKILSALPLETAKEMLWQIKEIGIGKELNTDDALIKGIIEGTILPNIKAAQRKYETATENGSKGGRPRLDIDMERVAALKAQGKSNEEIGRIVGACKTTIQTRWAEYQEEQKHKNQERKETETKKEKKDNQYIYNYIQNDNDIQKQQQNFLTAPARQTAQLENNNAPSAQQTQVKYKPAPSKKKQVAFDFSDIMKQDETEEDTFDISKNEEERKKEIARRIGL